MNQSSHETLLFSSRFIVFYQLLPPSLVWLWVDLSGSVITMGESFLIEVLFVFFFPVPSRPYFYESRFEKLGSVRFLSSIEALWVWCYAYIVLAIYIGGDV